VEDSHSQQGRFKSIDKLVVMFERKIDWWTEIIWKPAVVNRLVQNGHIIFLALWFSLKDLRPCIEEIPIRSAITDRVIHGTTYENTIH